MSTEKIHPMPFPGESPTISLALAAGRAYGLQPAEEKPSRAAPKRKAAAKKKPAKSAAKPKAAAGKKAVTKRKSAAR